MFNEKVNSEYFLKDFFILVWVIFEKNENYVKYGFRGIIYMDRINMKGFWKQMVEFGDRFCSCSSKGNIKIIGYQ